MMKTFSYRRTLKRILLVGVGGTGSGIAYALGRILYDLRAQAEHVPRLHLIDPDVVEYRNVGRQHFSPAEVGQPKAAVLARRLNMAFGLECVWHTTSFATDQHPVDHSLICGAVDNAQARASIQAAQPPLWLDCGNHATSGQVILGTCGDGQQVIASLDQAWGLQLPYAGLIFPELLVPPPPIAQQPARSCTEAVTVGQQHLLINSFMAMVAAQYLYQLLHQQPLATFMTFVSCADLSMRSLTIDAETLQAYLGQAVTS